MLVVSIDAGHGGKNFGTIHGREPHVLVEKDVTLAIARKLFESLNVPEIAPVLLRETDEHLSLSERGGLSMKHDSDLVVSIHVNAFDGKSHGLLCFYWPGNRRTRDVADTISEAAPRPLRRPLMRGYPAEGDSWPRVHNVMRYHAADALLVECGFADFESDRRYLLSEVGQHCVANAIRTGILHYLWLRSCP